MSYAAGFAPIHDPKIDALITARFEALRAMKAAQVALSQATSVHYYAKKAYREADAAVIAARRLARSKDTK